MRLYQSTDGRRLWFGTQAEARLTAGRNWQQVDVPTGKDELIGWLNGPQALAPQLLTPERVAPHGGEQGNKPVGLVAAPAPAPARFEPTIDTIEHWLLEAASVKDVERLFETIGTRIGELIRDRRIEA